MLNGAYLFKGHNNDIYAFFQNLALNDVLGSVDFAQIQMKNCALLAMSTSTSSRTLAIGKTLTMSEEIFEAKKYKFTL